MLFINSISACFRKFADYDGRAIRSELFWFLLFGILMMGLVCGIMVLVFFDESYWERAVTIGVAVVANILVLPIVFVSVRRLHDTGRSGWWLLCPVYRFVLFFLPSEKCENRYGKPWIDEKEVVTMPDQEMVQAKGLGQFVRMFTDYPASAFKFNDLKFVWLVIPVAGLLYFFIEWIIYRVKSRYREKNAAFLFENGFIWKSKRDALINSFGKDEIAEVVRFEDVESMDVQRTNCYNNVSYGILKIYTETIVDFKVKFKNGGSFEKRFVERNEYGKRYKSIEAVRAASDIVEQWEFAVSCGRVAGSAMSSESGEANAEERAVKPETQEEGKGKKKKLSPPVNLLGALVCFAAAIVVGYILFGFLENGGIARYGLLLLPVALVVQGVRMLRDAFEG